MRWRWSAASALIVLMAPASALAAPPRVADAVPSVEIAGAVLDYGVPTQITPPRQATLGARWYF